MNRLHTTAALFMLGACALASPAAAQGNLWSDSTSFNTPAGSTSSSFNDSAAGYGRDESGNRTIVDGRYVGSCYFNKDGITPGVGSRSGVDQAAGFPANPCTNQSAAPAQQNMAIGNSVTVMTQGSWNTVIVATNQTNNGNQTAILNGKLRLD